MVQQVSLVRQAVAISRPPSLQADRFHYRADRLGEIYTRRGLAQRFLNLVKNQIFIGEAVTLKDKYLFAVLMYHRLLMPNCIRIPIGGSELCHPTTTKDGLGRQ